MNEDKFLSAFQEAPPPQFADALYKRINQPMITQGKAQLKNRVVLATACAMLVFGLFLFGYPPARTYASSLLWKIGAIHFTTQEPKEVLPTAQPPNASEVRMALTAQEASQMAGFPVLSPSTLPEGFQPSSSFSIMKNQEGLLVANLFTNPVTESFILMNQYHYAASDKFTDTVDEEAAHVVTVRGNAGMWITGRMMTSPTEQTLTSSSKLLSTSWLIWEENSVVYTLISDTLSLNQSITLAESLR